MTPPVLASCGLDLAGHRLGPLRLEPGATGVWDVRHDRQALSALQTVLGLDPPPPGAVVWFGHDLASTPAADNLALLRRISVVTVDGGLIGNINACENILLPVLQRGGPEGESAASALEAMTQVAPWNEWFPAVLLGRLPHRLEDGERALAAVLRAALCSPEAVVVCLVRGSLDPREHDLLEAALRWLRGHLAGSTWLWIRSASALPATREEPSLPSIA